MVGRLALYAMGDAVPVRATPMDSGVCRQPHARRL